MPSPFPGMDPYLEGYLWPDVHQALASKIRQYLVPLLRPHYTARLGIYVVEDNAPEGDIGILYPDVEIMHRPGATTFSRVSMQASVEMVQATPAVLSVPLILPIDVQIPVVEIYDTAQNQLVTSIEILSPVNKREPGLTAYRQKRQRLYQAGVHLFELDLLRRGTRPVIGTRIPQTPYLIGLTRAHSGRTEIWPLHFRDHLPTLPVPLRQIHEDVLLDMAGVFRDVYDEAGYDLSINYHTDPPPPALSDGERELLQTVFTYTPGS